VNWLRLVITGICKFYNWRRLA